MKRFVAEQNIQHFKHLLENDMDPERREVIERLLGEARRELAAIENATEGRNSDQPSQTNDNAGGPGDQSGSSKRRG